MSAPSKPNVRRPQPTTTGSANKARPATTCADKRPREPCADELLYKQLLKEERELQNVVSQQRGELVDLERSILQFYYTHSIGYQTESHEPDSDAAASPTAKRAAGSSSTRTGYYQLSEMSVLRQAHEAKKAAHSRELLEREAAIADMENDVEENIVKGILAAQKAATLEAEKAVQQLHEDLDAQKKLADECRAAIAAENAKCASIRSETDACRERKLALEEKKKRQMTSVESTRQELLQARADTQKAQKELKRREAVVKDLQRQIEQRRSRLKRRKVK